MTLFLDDGDVRLYQGDALEVLRTLPDGCVDMVATSPPFYGLRDYGTGEWDGGDPDCDHIKAQRQPQRDASGGFGGRDLGTRGQQGYAAASGVNIPYGETCGKCGARRVDRQIGLEETPDQWVTNLVNVFRECRRVLADHGTLWVEIGDSYNNAGSSRNGEGLDGIRRGGATGADGELGYKKRDRRHSLGDIKHKDLLGQPWMLAFALRADGWYLRSEIIWARPNPMPESVTDRPTKSHSTVFLLSKQPRYFYDADAIREQYSAASATGQRTTAHYDTAERYGAGNGGNSGLDGLAAKMRASAPRPQVETLDGSEGESPRGPDGRRVTHIQKAENSEQHRDGERWPNPSGANARSVWRIDEDDPIPGIEREAPLTDQQLREQRAGGAGARGRGDRRAMSAEETGRTDGYTKPPRNAGHLDAPNARSVWQIPTEPTPFAHFATWPRKLVARMIQAGTSERGKCPECGKPWVRDVEKVVENRVNGGKGENADRVDGGKACNADRTYTTLGWSPSCDCAADPVPCVVLDPFAGSGTTLLVARHHGRHAIGIELNPDYLKIAADRLSQLSLLTEASG